MNHENGKEKASFSKAGKNCADITRLDDTLVFIDIFTKINLQHGYHIYPLSAEANLDKK